MREYEFSLARILTGQWKPAFSHILCSAKFLFDLGCEYRTVGCQRSLISAYHDYIDNKRVGQNPLLIERPLQPRYILIWHIQTVLDFVERQWPGCDLSDKVLTNKLVILMALSFASRASAIHHLDVRYMLKPEEKFVFTFNKLHKSWKYEKAPPIFEFLRIQRTGNFVW